MKCSIIIAVLDSHEIFRRQLLHLSRILSQNWEVIVVDDGSQPPLRYHNRLPFPFRLLYTHDQRPWTQDKARNMGATAARGEYLLMLDIDHVVTRKVVANVNRFRGDMLKFARRVGELDDEGRLRGRGRAVRVAPNIFAIRKALFEQMGGYVETAGIYGTDRHLQETYRQFVKHRRAKSAEIGETLYVITDPKWFHKLSRKLR